MSAWGVRVEHDPGVWLPGPVAGDDEATVEQWVEGALAACAADLRVEDGTSEHEHLRVVLEGFARADLGSAFRFLRLRAVDDVPVVARLDLLAAEAPADEVLTALDPSRRWYDAAPVVRDVDPDLGLRRSVAMAVEEVDGTSAVRPVVRWHRRVEEWGVDVLMSAGGVSLRVMTRALDDLDGLARSVRVVDEQGVRR